MKSRVKWILNILFLLLVLAATMFYVFRGQNMPVVLQALQQAKPGWWGFGFVLVFICVSCEGLILWLLIRSMGIAVRLWHCVLNSFTGFFFCCITPSATGGQPFQVYLMNRDGVPPSLSVPLLLIVIINYKIVLLVIALAVFLLRPPVIMACLAPVMGWFWLGMVLNVLVITLYAILIFRPVIIERVLGFFLQLGKRWIREEKAAQWQQKLQQGMVRYGSVAVWIKKHPLFMLRIFAITFFQRCCMFGVTYLAFRSFGLESAGLPTVLTLQAMICLAADMMPMPGGTGLNEILFLRLFVNLSGQKLVLPLMILSRGIGFYGEIAMGAVLTVVAFLTIGRQKKGEPIARTPIEEDTT